jgi:ABC-type uncharacterized transport system substrate-binding protein
LRGEGFIESGIVESFDRPGANVTGLSMFAAELDAKRLKLLLTALPNATTVAVLSPGLAWGTSSRPTRRLDAFRRC